MNYPRIHIEATEHDAQHEELLAKARAIGGDVVKVEVEYPREREVGAAGWDVSGDAVEVDFTVDPPVVTTLPPYEESTP